MFQTSLNWHVFFFLLILMRHFSYSVPSLDICVESVTCSVRMWPHEKKKELETNSRLQILAINLIFKTAVWPFLKKALVVNIRRKSFIIKGRGDSSTVKGWSWPGWWAGCHSKPHVSFIYIFLYQDKKSIFEDIILTALIKGARYLRDSLGINI